jgi:tetratricopeptide (TPR) repeat protein
MGPVAFEGDLKNLPLADVLQSIHQNNLTGTLSVKDVKGERRVAFAGGFIVAFQAAPGEGHGVIEFLAKRRVVAKSAAEKARSGFLGKRKTLRMALASRGLISEEDYQKIVKEDVLEGIYELFLETDRTFKFEDGSPDLGQWDADQVCAELRLAPPGIVMEGARRTDEWQRIRRAIGSFHEVLVRDSDQPEPEDDEVTKELLRLADGTRDLHAILEALPIPNFKGCEIAAQLIQERRLRPASSNEYVTLGQKAEDRGAFDEAASLYERGLSTERGNLELRRRRAQALERAGRKADAASERKLLAEALFDQGKRGDAAAEFLRAADLEPRDPHALERRLQIAQEDQDKDAVRVISARLATLYEDLGLGDKARDLLRAQAVRDNEDEELREKLAELLVRLGDVKGAAKEWRELAGRSARRENLALAAARYRRAVEIDPGDEASRAALKDIESGEVLARRMRRRQRIRIALLSILLGGLAGWAVWEGEGLRELQDAEVNTVYERVAEGTPEGIEAAIREVVGHREAFQRTLVARHQDEALTFKLIQIYAQLFAKASLEPIVPPLPPKSHSRGQPSLPMLVKTLDPDGSPTLEKLVNAGDDALDAKDYATAGKTFDEALARIQKARALLAQWSNYVETRDDEWTKVMTRLPAPLARSRAGRLRALPLDERSRAELEQLVGRSLPAVK